MIYHLPRQEHWKISRKHQLQQSEAPAKRSPIKHGDRIETR
jgi:hypothetical protein